MQKPKPLLLLMNKMRSVVIAIISKIKFSFIIQTMIIHWPLLHKSISSMTLNKHCIGEAYMISYMYHQIGNIIFFIFITNQ